MDAESSSEFKKVIESLSTYFEEKLRLPIVIAYLSILILYNWDMLYFISFDKRAALCKIDFVRNRFTHEYYNRVLNPALISIVGTIAITIVQVGLNYLLSYFRKKDLWRIHSEEIEFAKNKNKVIKALRGIDELKDALVENERLKEDLTTKTVEFNKSQREFEVLSTEYSAQKLDYEKLEKSNWVLSQQYNLIIREFYKTFYTAFERQFPGEDGQSIIQLAKIINAFDREFKFRDLSIKQEMKDIVGKGLSFFLSMGLLTKYEEKNKTTYSKTFLGSKIMDMIS